LWPAGTLCITIAANIAETGILDFPACFPDSIVGFVADSSVCNVRFVEYHFRGVRNQIQFEASEGGTVQDNINVATLDRLRIPIPEKRVQDALAEALGAFDDKIELNRRMNQTLESMARAIFRSWFVDFDPVVAKAAGRQPFGMSAEVAAHFPDRFVESAIGPVPEGWQLGRLDDLVVLQRGYDLPATQRTPGIYPVLTAGGPTGTHCEFKVRGPGITTGRSGQLGAVYFVHEDFWPLNTSLYVKEFRASSPLHAFFLLQTLDFDSFNAGSAVPTLNRNHVHNLPVVVPPEEILTQFNGFAEPLFSLSHNNEAESRTLAVLRDTLLPKLMSGELRVRDAGKLAGIHA
jgi:type I restriction enzyme S subunit